MSIYGLKDDSLYEILKYVGDVGDFVALLTTSKKMHKIVGNIVRMYDVFEGRRSLIDETPLDQIYAVLSSEKVSSKITMYFKGLFFLKNFFSDFGVILISEPSPKNPYIRTVFKHFSVLSNFGFNETSKHILDFILGEKFSAFLGEKTFKMALEVLRGQGVDVSAFLGDPRAIES